MPARSARLAAIDGQGRPDVLSRVLGLGGSSSRMIREHLVERRLAQPLPLQRRRAGQQLVEQHAQRVDVAARVDVQAR